MAKLSFSKQDFIDLKVDELLSEVDVTDQLAYSKALRSAISDSPTDEKRDILRFLEALVSSSLRLDHPDNPYGFLDDLAPEVLSFFSDVIDETSDPEIRSRIADLLWLRKRDHKMAELAIDSYLSAAKLFEDFENWTRTLRRLERAMQLASQLGKKNGKYPIVIGVISDLLDRCNGEDPLFLSAELM